MEAKRSASAAASTVIILISLTRASSKQVTHLAMAEVRPIHRYLYLRKVLKITRTTIEGLAWGKIHKLLAVKVKLDKRYFWLQSCTAV